MNVEVGQTWASMRPQDISRGHNQHRRVLDVVDVERKRWSMSSVEPEITLVKAAVLTCDGNGGKMRSKIGIKPNGLPGHRLVAEPDPHVKALAEVFRGIPTRPPYGYYDHIQDVPTSDLADEVYAMLLWPRKPSGEQNPKMELTLHQEALTAVAERLLTLVQVVEQNALASAEAMEA